MSCGQQPAGESPTTHPAQRCACHHRNPLPNNQQQSFRSQKTRLKLTTVSRVQLHRLESLILLQRRASPLPKASHAALSGELVAVLGDGHGVPVIEAHVRLLEVDEEGVGIGDCCDAGGAVGGGLGWRGFFDAIVDKVAGRGVSRCVGLRGVWDTIYPLTAGIVFSSFCDASFACVLSA